MKILIAFIIHFLFISSSDAGSIKSLHNSSLITTIHQLNSQKPPYSLPQLSYDHEALMPIIDQETMMLHHSKHHQAYINNLNKLLDKDQQTNLLQMLSTISTYSDSVRNNGGGHWNHSFFWTILTPNKEQNKMPKALLLKIEKNFKSFSNFKSQFEAAALAVFGSGWVWLIQNAEGRLLITTTLNQDNPLMDTIQVRGTPVLGLDVWEHAYYLKYQNKRADYIKGFWTIINWEQVESYRKESLNNL